jgi:hypothetical protein
MEDILDAVGESKKMKCLCMNIEDEQDAIPTTNSLAKLTNLEELDLSIPSSHRHSQLVGEAIVRLFGTSSNLHKLTLHGVDFRSEALGNVLKYNSVLTNIVLDEVANTDMTLKEIVSALREGCCALDWIEVIGRDGAVIMQDMRDELAYLCLLNRCGRAKVRRTDATLCALVELLAGVAECFENDNEDNDCGPCLAAMFNETSVLYELLRELPHLWCHVHDERHLSAKRAQNVNDHHPYKKAKTMG